MDGIVSLDVLEKHQTQDPLITQAMEQVGEIVWDAVDVARLEQLALFVTDFESAPPQLRDSIYFTDSSRAILTDSAVIVNERFLFETEAAIRSFELSESLLGSPYLRSDEALFGLVNMVQSAPQSYLRRLRRLAQRQKQDGDARNDLPDALALAALFFIGHEVGHLLIGNDQRSFSTFVKPDDPFDLKVSNAVVKLCRHADEFQKFKFDLAGFEPAVTPGSDVRQFEERYRQEIKDAYVSHTKWFADENSADSWAIKLVVDYLDELSTRDEVAADRQQFLLVKALFAVGLYYWYKDLQTFGDNLGGGGLQNSGGLTAAMLRDREQYIRAASLFGDVHRFTLLRSALAIEAILKARTSFFDTDAGEGTIWCSGEAGGQPRDTDALRQWRLSQSLQRYYLLCILMDTAVKIAHVGCSTGWMLQKDQQRGTPQIFMMTFESIRAAVERLRRLA